MKRAALKTAAAALLLAVLCSLVSIAEGNPEGWLGLAVSTILLNAVCGALLGRR